MSKQKIQMCEKCDDPTGRCEDDSFCSDGVVLCEECFKHFDYPSDHEINEANICNNEYKQGIF